ncbi:unnamed protein product [Acanthoscelides obtectus]|uniref:DDE Tnp4 domain-containing protein n=1 Tax=Acanthoscelides obtectus TaxID=200917 RepID=A0A9P0KT68_ACAOB|nr:unnamed protein product [Acanthoscelides obtectus]CAK1678237.1 Putative nuclease HARBI1 [Acanthoscelides obtectus]
MVFVTLRYLATGSFLQVIGDVQGMDKGTASRVVSKVIKSLAVHFKELIKMPENGEERTAIRQEFFNIARFPRCIGALDCTHIKIKSPGGADPENYRNRKGFFSYNVQVICDATLKIQNIVCRWPGASHDANIFANSRVRALFETGHFGDSLLVADSGYGIKPYLITPLSRPETQSQHLFNESQIRTRNPVERCFGVWKRRFPILALGIRVAKEKIEPVVVATAALHNLAIIMKDPQPAINNEIEAAVEFINNFDIVPVPVGGQDASNNRRRLLLINYFQDLL